MSEKIFHQDTYAKKCAAVVSKVCEFGIRLDRTVFYPTGGGQPGDTGVLLTTAGLKVEIINTIIEKNSGDHLHVLTDDAPPLAVGDAVAVELDWERRYAHMRMHSALHLLCAVIDGGVTGGSISAEKGRLDFDLPDILLDKKKITTELNQLVDENHLINVRWITEEELSANSGLVRTLSVQPPRGSNRVRLLEIGNVDLQPCGGTHVRSTGEIGKLRVGKIENKGKRNRRINLHFVGPEELK